MRIHAVELPASLLRTASVCWNAFDTEFSISDLVVRVVAILFLPVTVPAERDLSVDFIFAAGLQRVDGAPVVNKGWEGVGTKRGAESFYTHLSQQMEDVQIFTSL